MYTSVLYNIINCHARLLFIVTNVQVLLLYRILYGILYGILCYHDRVKESVKNEIREDIYIMVLSVLVSVLNPNHTYVPLLSTVYCNTICSGF